MRNQLLEEHTHVYDSTYWFFINLLLCFWRIRA